MSETVLVTGGTGFVAGWCIVELLRRGYTVRATVRDTAKGPAVRAAVATAVAAGDRLTFWTADLTRDEGWDAAMAGCDYVLHVASPLGGEASGDPDALVVPAREGTLRVLRAAANAGVKRVVMTSSTAACTPPPAGTGTVGDESVWTDPAGRGVNAYRKSKILAERAAWDFMAGHPGSTTLTTVLPGAVFGPVLTTANLGSVGLVKSLLDGRLPGTPRVGFCVIDVRDLADLHIRAMTAPEAEGERFIATGDFMWMRDIARTLRARLGERASKVPTRNLPDVAVRTIALVAPMLRSITPLLGQKRVFSSAKARRMLGFAPRPATTTVVDCAESLVAATPVAA
ncbi:SDR family oxidoreductase [Nonomuraea sp. M3C6]|uniref:SDR family oxidoreductase n=1 Tax=Nonomuraea marmarensis TaxID=3351344 RepID=A0ABW7AFS9_9ACTN